MGGIFDHWCGVRVHFSRRGCIFYPRRPRMCPPVWLAGNMLECKPFRLKIVTVLVGRTFGMFGPFGFGPAPQSSAGLLWKALDGFGWLWKDLGGFGRLWAVLQGSGRLLMFLEVCKRMWKGLAALLPTSRSAWTSPLRIRCGIFRMALGGPPSHAQIHPREAICPLSGRNHLRTR